ncbi:MAG: hypothetical protein RR449_07500, partial [Christensenella sp.]
ITNAAQNTAEWATQKTISATVKEGMGGSGVAEVWYTPSGTDSVTGKVVMPLTSGSVYTSPIITVPKTYYVWSKDNAGNTTAPGVAVVVDKVKDVAPSAKPIPISTWANFQKIGSYEIAVIDGTEYALTPNAKYVQTAPVLSAPANTTYKTLPAFSGTYDGNNYVIDCANVVTWAHTVYDGIPMHSIFGYVTGTVKNIEINNVTMNVAANTNDRFTMVGAAIGKAENAAISNVTVNNANITVTANAAVDTIMFAGFILGQDAFGNNSNLCVKNSVMNVDVSKGLMVGGIAGEQFGNGTLTGNNVLTNNEMNVKANGNNWANSGGVIGAVTTGQVEGVKVIGGSLNLSGTVNTASQGGLIGASHIGADAKVLTLKNSSTENFDITRKSFVTSGGARMAGAVAEGTVHADNVHVKGGTIDISGDGVDEGSRSNRYNGGFGGCLIYDTKLTNCSTSANIVVNDPLAVDQSGGFAGIVDRDTAGTQKTFDNCRATGTISIGAGVKPYVVGGFFGCNSNYQEAVSATFKNCYTSTKISGGEQALNFGGFIGASFSTLSTYENNMWVKNFTTATKGVGNETAKTDGIDPLHVTPDLVENLGVGASQAITSVVAGGFAYADLSIKSGGEFAGVENGTNAAKAAVKGIKEGGTAMAEARFTKAGQTDITVPINITTVGAVSFIPIYTWEQFDAVGRGGKMTINGKEYTMAANASYKQMNDIAADKTSYVTKPTFTGVYDGGGYALDLKKINENGWQSAGPAA